MKIKELFEADIIHFGAGLNSLKNKTAHSNDPRTYRQTQDIKKRAAAKSNDLSNIDHKKMMNLASSVDNKYLKDMWLQYMDTALWASTDIYTDDSLDTNYYPEYISSDTMQKMLKMCEEFKNKAGNLLDGINPDKAGHDFWLTQQRHGTGFWDGDYPEEVGEKLTQLSQSFPEINLYVGDDGLIHS